MVTEDRAPEGSVWVCMMCGKMAEDRRAMNTGTGWDISCFINAELHRKDVLVIVNNRVVGFKK